MSWEHERVEELLAVRSLNGLDPDEAALADRAVVEHVSTCPTCREAMQEFDLLAGELALATPAVEPPHTLLGRLRRTVSPRRPSGWRGRWAAAVAAVLIVGMSAWNVVLADRIDDAELRQRWLVDAVTTLGHPDVSTVSLQGSDTASVTLMFVTGRPSVYVVASSLPEPRGVYRVWFTQDERAWSPGTLELDRGRAMLPVKTDVHRWEVVMVTDEPNDDSPTPAATPVVSAPVSSP